MPRLRICPRVAASLTYRPSSQNPLLRPYSVRGTKVGVKCTGQGPSARAGREARYSSQYLFGPIESARIESVFARMDELQGVEPGSTGKEFRDLMITTRTSDGGRSTSTLRPLTLHPALSGLRLMSHLRSQDTTLKSLTVCKCRRKAARSLYRGPTSDSRISRVRLCSFWVAMTTKRPSPCGTPDSKWRPRHVGLRNLNTVGHARSLLQARNLDDVQLSHLDPLRRESVDRSMQLMSDHFGRLDRVILLPQKLTVNTVIPYALRMMRTLRTSFGAR